MKRERFRSVCVREDRERTGPRDGIAEALVECKTGRRGKEARKWLDAVVKRCRVDRGLGESKRKGVPGIRQRNGSEERRERLSKALPNAPRSRQPRGNFELGPGAQGGKVVGRRDRERKNDETGKRC